MTRRQSGAEEGFTLVETLVAFTILVAVITVSFEIVAESLRHMADIKDRGQRIAVARVVLARFQLSAKPPPRETTGTTDGIDWTITAAPVALDAPALQASALRPYRVQVFVRQRDTEDENTPILDTIALLPGAIP